MRPDRPDKKKMAKYVFFKYASVSLSFIVIHPVEVMHVYHADQSKNVFACLINDLLGKNFRGVTFCIPAVSSHNRKIIKLLETTHRDDRSSAI